MRACPSCGKENPDDRDFCDCGEYLRWEPTGYMQAVTPEMAAEAAPPAEPAAPAQPAPPQQPATPQPPTAPPDEYHTAMQPAAPPPPQAPPPQPPAQPAPPPAAAPPPQPVHHTAIQPAAPAPQSPEPIQQESAAISLRLPDGEAVKGEALALGIDPGGRERVLALVRNQSGIVDNYALAIEGMPDDWYSIYPDTVYLVPFGAGGTFEQEVEIHLHPPRSPEAKSRVWELTVTAYSKAHEQPATSAPMFLGIQPYEDFKPKLKPERASGRRKAQFDVTIDNKANAPVAVGLDATDPEAACAYKFKSSKLDVEPGASESTTMTVRPPKPIWIGRPTEHRIELLTHTGEELAAHEEEAAAEDGLDEPEGKGKRRFGGGIPGVQGPKFRAPNVNVGPGGVRVGKPVMQGPRARAPRANLNLSNLKVPGRGGGAPAAPSAPLLPTQAVFRQKPWLPWWVAMVVPLLALLALLLFLFLPRNVVVPDVTKATSTFDAEKLLTEDDLKLSANTKEVVTDKEEPGSIVGQTPEAGEKAKKDSEVTVQIAVGSGKIEVPKLVGMTPSDADKALRKEKLSLGQATPQPADPKAKIESQIPAAKQVVKEGTPVNIFLAKPGKETAGKDKGKDKSTTAVVPPGEKEGGGDIVVPPIEEADVKAYGQKVAEKKLVPEQVNAFNEAKPGTVFGTDPEPGTKLAEGAKVKVLVSAGFPQLLYDDENDIRLINGADGKPLDPVSKGPELEKDPTWSFDGANVAYVSDGRVFLKDMKDQKKAPFAITPEGEQYRDLAWAPTAEANVLAMTRLSADKGRDICFGQIDQNGLKPDCISEPELDVGRAIHWANNGRSLMVFGQKGSESGIVRYRSKKAFSPSAGDWGKGRFLTVTDKPGKGVIDAALSPDGKKLALVTNFGSDRFLLSFAKPGDFQMTDAKRTSIQACKVAWRSDSKELVVVQADAGCTQESGSLVRVEADNTRQGFTLNAKGDNPAFQPLTLPE